MRDYRIVYVILDKAARFTNESHREFRVAANSASSAQIAARLRITKAHPGVRFSIMAVREA